MPIHPPSLCPEVPPRPQHLPPGPETAEHPPECPGEPPAEAGRSGQLPGRGWEGAAPFSLCPHELSVWQISALLSTCPRGMRSTCCAAPRSTWPPRWCAGSTTTPVLTCGRWASSFTVGLAFIAPGGSAQGWFPLSIFPPPLLFPPQKHFLGSRPSLPIPSPSWRRRSAVTGLCR